MKKLIAIVMIFALLVPISPAVAADEMSAPPTVEEILNEYHRKAFEARTQGESETASTWSHRGETQTLEQETVDTLTAAVYEAYNVTADNYETLENELNTDFASMGLDPEGSYIVVISGEDPAATEGASTYNVSPNPEIIGPPDGGDSTFFTYTYNNLTYNMRFLTVVPTTTNGQFIWSEYRLTSEDWIQSGVADIANAALGAAIDSVPIIPPDTTFPIVSILGLIVDVATDENYVQIDPTNVRIEARSNWTCEVIQIWCFQHSCWESMQYSEYVCSKAQTLYFIDVSGASEPEEQYSDWYSCTFYSPMYFEYSQRYEDAVVHYLTTEPSHDEGGEPDCVYSVRFGLAGDDVEITDGTEGAFLFAHIRNFNVADNIN